MSSPPRGGGGFSLGPYLLSLKRSTVDRAVEDRRHDVHETATRARPRPTPAPQADDRDRDPRQTVRTRLRVLKGSSLLVVHGLRRFSLAICTLITCRTASSPSNRLFHRFDPSILPGVDDTHGLRAWRPLDHDTRSPGSWLSLIPHPRRAKRSSGSDHATSPVPAPDCLGARRCTRHSRPDVVAQRPRRIVRSRHQEHPRTV
jgi:hypothetical protein